MQNSEYWKLRFEQLEVVQNGQGAAAVAEIEKQYKEAQKQIEGQIARWYQRFADNNGISLAEARQYLKGAALKEFKWDVQDYIKYGQDNALMGGWMKELENASAKYHISKLEALKIQTQQSLEVMFSKQLGTVTGAMGDVFESGYYHTAYELQKGFNIGWDIAGLDQSQIEKVLAKPWAVDGKNFSERIWGNKQKLISEVHGELTQNIMLGADPQKAIDSLAKKMKTSRYNAGRLIMTEEAYFSSAAQKDCFEELGVEQFEIVATLDSHTSDICRSLDGKHFPMKDFQPGVTAPPFHVWCRSTTVPYFEDNYGGERAARGADGKTYQVPADMTYPEWKKSFVDGGDKSELKEIKNDDTMSLKNKISDQDNKIDELKNQFSDATDGYSYDEWFSEFSSIEEGYGDAPDGDATFTKLKNLDEEIRNAEKQRSDLLLQKESRGQLDTGFPGKIPDDKLDEYNAKGFEQIKVDTGYSEEQATKFHDALKEYFGGDYESILDGETTTAKIIRDGLDRMPIYDGEISRGMVFTSDDVKQFSCLKPGDVLPQKGLIESWSSSKEAAVAYSGISDYDRSSVILECINNQTGVGVQHLSLFGNVEAEVLASSRYEVVEIIVENKYDYLTKHKEFLYFEEDLIDEELTMKGNVICRIKVKEKH